MSSLRLAASSSIAGEPLCPCGCSSPLRVYNLNRPPVCSAFWALLPSFVQANVMLGAHVDRAQAFAAVQWLAATAAATRSTLRLQEVA